MDFFISYALPIYDDNNKIVGIDVFVYDKDNNLVKVED